MRVYANPMWSGELLMEIKSISMISLFSVYQMPLTHLLAVILFYLGSHLGSQAAPVPPPVLHEAIPLFGSSPPVHSSIMKSAIAQEAKSIFTTKQAPPLVKGPSMPDSMHRSSSTPSLVIKDQRTDRSSMRHAQSEPSLKELYSQYVSDTYQSIYDELLSKVITEEPVLGMRPRPRNDEQWEANRELEDSTGENRVDLPPARMARSSRRSDGSKSLNV